MILKRDLFRILSAIFLLSLSSSIGAQPLTVQAGMNIFPDPQGDGRAYVEFPFTINRSQFQFDSTEDGQWLRAAVYAEMLLTDTLDNSVDTAGTFFYTRVKDSIEAGRKDIKLFNKLHLMVPPGVYKGKMTVIDASNKREGAFLFNKIEIDPIEMKHLKLSDLELAYRIRPVDSAEEVSGQNRLVKNGLEILPSPMGVFSEKDSSIYIYAELYNLQFKNISQDSFNVSFKVFDDRGEMYYDFGNVNLPKPGPSAVISNVLDIEDWAPGKYDLRVTATDYANTESDMRIHRFVIFPQEGQFASMAYQYVSPLDTAGIVTLSNVIKYVVKANDYVLFNNLTESGKTRFVRQFFSDNDPTPGTPRNEFLEDVFNRYVYANENFSSFPDAGDGWRSDRGRVLMQYGIPDEIKDAISPSLVNPWQKWNYYQLQGGVYFVFVDEEGYGDYRLVHSTASGEKYDDDWEQATKGFDTDKFLED